MNFFSLATLAILICINHQLHASQIAQVQQKTSPEYRTELATQQWQLNMSYLGTLGINNILNNFIKTTLSDYEKSGKEIKYYGYLLPRLQYSIGCNLRDFLNQQLLTQELIESQLSKLNVAELSSFYAQLKKQEARKIHSILKKPRINLITDSSQVSSSIAPTINVIIAQDRLKKIHAMVNEYLNSAETKEFIIKEIETSNAQPPAGNFVLE